MILNVTFFSDLATKLHVASATIAELLNLTRDEGAARGLAFWETEAMPLTP